MIKITLSDFKKFVAPLPVSVKIKKRQGGVVILVPIAQDKQNFTFCITRNGKVVWPLDKAVTCIATLTQQTEETIEELISGSGKTIEVRGANLPGDSVLEEAG